MINIALIGIGYWGSKLMTYIKNSDQLSLRYAVNSKYDLNKIWNDPAVDAVVIATPNETHYQIAKDALLWGRHVLCEKPLAKEYEYCLELKQLAHDKGLALLTDYIYTFSPSLKRALDNINNHQIGKLKNIDIQFKRLGRFYHDNVYWLLGSHMLAVIDMFVPLDRLHSNFIDTFRGSNNTPESGIIYLWNDYTCDFTVFINVSLNTPERYTNITFYGEKGTMVYDPINIPSLKLSRYEHTTDNPPAHDTLIMHNNEINNLQYMFDHFIQCIEGKAHDNIDTSIKVTKVLKDMSL